MPPSLSRFVRDVGKIVGMVGVVVGVWGIFTENEEQLMAGFRCVFVGLLCLLLAEALHE